MVNDDVVADITDGLDSFTCTKCGKKVQGLYDFYEHKCAEEKKEDARQEIPETDTQTRIAQICDGVKNILLMKNRQYGDSAIHPRRIFSKAGVLEQINVRIDDKLSRIAASQADDTEDAELDLIGYLILKRVAKERNRR